MVHPRTAGGPPAHPDMPADVERDYEEARQIVQASPRGACALLQVARERLVEELQPKGQDLNDRIGKLVEAGLPEVVRQSMDTLRIIGGSGGASGDARPSRRRGDGVRDVSLVNLISTTGSLR